ncbi:MAG: helix-turn-helix domain-containing protein [Planctomycetota bacterium]|nr:helix-turn-helix domain-containing protein [Planctomycetota bacterium]
MAPRKHQMLHSHEFHEFFYCAEGAGHQYRETAELRMQKGDLFLFPADVMHKGAGDPGGGCLGVVLYINDRAFAEVSEGDAEAAAMLKALVRYGRERGARLPLSVPGRERVDTIMRRMGDEAHDRRPGYRCALKNLMSEFLVTMLRDEATASFMHTAVAPVTTHDQIDDVRRYLDVHFRESITVGEMADVAGLSRSHFHAVFKRETGATLTNYLQTLRISEAQRLLREDSMSIIEVAMASGFSSLSHFYEVFGSRVGCSPKAYRARG